MKNEIGLQSIKDLLGMNFYIPSYQRGYRWTKQQVEDLLNDIQEFIEKKQNGFYCIQPLVVKVKDANNNQWEVIDGQQRLTTIYILLSCLNNAEKKYAIEYETRTDSKTFLASIDESKKEDNIDYYHMIIAKQTIEEWFKSKSKGQTEKDKFKETLLEKVDFIWYESADEDPIKVFTRLNIGKIALTNAELIKAMFLNKSNFQAGSDYQKIRLQQQEIAVEWDKIEYTLQNDEFWLFLNKPDYDKPTRIDFIFDLLRKEDVLDLRLTKEQLGTDEYKTFRYFYFWFKKNSDKMLECWKKIKTLFQTFQEWYNDLELYHYVGFLVEQGVELSDIVEKWRKESLKDTFISDYIISTIKDKIGNIEDLSALQYRNGTIRSILLLHNIQSVIIQNARFKENEKYKLPVFYKFPFHLFKKVKEKQNGWDVEHIDSNTENEIKTEKDKKMWLEYAKDYVSKELQDRIAAYLEKEEKEEKEDQPDFEELRTAVFDFLEKDLSDDLKQTPEEKNSLQNLCLLDAGTNRGYGNAVFPAKRKIIISNDQSGTFIPPCTKNVFSKYYNTKPNNLLIWDKNDAEAYLKNIEITLKKFLKKGETNNGSN